MTDLVITQNITPSIFSVISMEAVNEQIKICDDGIENILPFSTYKEDMNTAINILKTTKLVFVSLKNKNTNKNIYKLLMEKYDKLLELYISFQEDLVTKGERQEGGYLVYCQFSLEQRNNLKWICDFATNFEN